MNTDKITEDKIKDILLDYIYDKIDVEKYKYITVEDVSNIYPLKIKKHYATANSCGINSFIVFTKKNNKFYSYIIDRRTISHKRISLKKDKVRIIKFTSSVNLNFYDGTIFDGILINSDFVNDTKKSVVITDVYSLCGNNMLNIDYKVKMNMILNFLPNINLNVNVNEINNNFNNNFNQKVDIEFIVNKPYEINQLIQLINNNEILDLNVKNNIKGITFYPQFSDKKIIYIFDRVDGNTKRQIYENNFVLDELDTDLNINSNTNTNTNNSNTNNQKSNISSPNISSLNNSNAKYSKQNISNFKHSNSNNLYQNNSNPNNSIKDNNNGTNGTNETNDNSDNKQNKKILKFMLSDVEIIDDIILNFEMCKTHIFDVFTLFTIFIKNDKYIKKYIGIAHIPTYELSLKCKKLFENNNKLIMKCKFDSSKNRWIPIDKSLYDKIDILNKDNRIKIIEEYEYITNYGDE